jgi:hypothetical protein
MRDLQMILYNVFRRYNIFILFGKISENMLYSKPKFSLSFLLSVIECVVISSMNEWWYNKFNEAREKVFLRGGLFHLFIPSGGNSDNNNMMRMSFSWKRGWTSKKKIRH